MNEPGDPAVGLMPQRFCSVNGEVDVWRLFLGGEPTDFRKLGTGLSPEENERADRYRYEQDRTKFIAGRVVLRKILSSYTGLPPGDIGLATMPNGKPVLTNGPKPLYFNLAHSRDIVLYAISPGRTVGIDIEWMDPEMEIMDIAERNFSPGEFARFRSAPQEEQLRLFYRIWTAKEAFLKGIGCGLAVELNQVHVQFDPVARDRATSVRHCREPESKGWPVVELGTDLQYISTLALDGGCHQSGRPISCH